VIRYFRSVSFSISAFSGGGNFKSNCCLFLLYFLKLYVTASESGNVLSPYFLEMLAAALGFYVFYFIIAVLVYLAALTPNPVVIVRLASRPTFEGRF
jgi:hypothetical protein